ncbi:MAG: hypothetical protein J6J43_01945 [Oscillospiraceae bacterium]|nr:hypothetical protein [Oscillospiraceae bacterium]
MTRQLRIWSILLALLLLAACGKTVPPVTETPDVPPMAEETVQEETQALPQSPDLTIFDGTYRANVPEEGDEGYVQIKAQNGLLLLEHFLCMEGSVYSFWAEEFRPLEDGFVSGEFTSVSGISQTFSVMTGGDGYDTMPQNRVITLTEDGVVLNYDDSDAAYYVADETFSYHSTLEQLQQILGESTGKADASLFGTWVCRNSRETVCISFREDGSVSLLQKKMRQPVQAYEGAFVFEPGGYVSIAAEKAGDGMYPHIMRLGWHVDPDDMLWLTFEDETQLVFLPTQEKVTETMAPTEALSWLGDLYDLSGEYTDQYENEYTYLYRLPYFLGSDPEVLEVNRQIEEAFVPIIEEECSAMEQSEFLSYTEVDWESNVHDGILYLHIYAKTWDWEEHRAYYYDVAQGEFLTAQEVLDRLLIDQNYFLEAVREYAQAAFEETFAELPEEDREAFGYYDMLEWTASEEAVNLQLPIYVDMFGSVVVHAKIGSMAGSGIIWVILRPFDGAVG